MLPQEHEKEWVSGAGEILSVVGELLSGIGWQLLGFTVPAVKNRKNIAKSTESSVYRLKVVLTAEETLLEVSCYKSTKASPLFKRLYQE